MAGVGSVSSAATTTPFLSSTQRAGSKSDSIIDVGDLPDGIIDVGDLPGGIIDVGDLPDGVSKPSFDRFA